MAILPTRILEIEFDAGIWTNVTADLVSINSRRGRNRESGAFETGTMTFALRNDARKYDPDNAAGTYYGKLRPNRRVRFKATYNAITYDVFFGYIDRIAQIGGGPNDAVAEFQVSDFFKLLNRVDLPPSAYAAEVAADNPTYWWRFDEPSGSTVATDTIAGVQAQYQGDATALHFGEQTLVVRDPGAGIRRDNTLPQAWLFVDQQLLVTTPFTIEYLFKSVDLAATGNEAPVLDILNSASDPWLRLTQTATGNPMAARLFTSGGPYTASSAGTLDGATHHAALVVSGGTMQWYIDGAASGAAVAIPAITWDASQKVYIFGVPWVNGLNGTVDELAFYNTALSAGRIAAHSAASKTPWNGDTPGARLNRIFALVPNTATYVVDTGEPNLQATNLGGAALGYAQKVEETTGGLLFVAKNGDVTFIGRNSAVTGAYLTSQATLVDDDSGAGIPYRQADADVDEARIVTRATVSREGSTALQYFDAAAKTEFGWLDETHDGLLHNSDSYSVAYAQWIVTTHKAPSSRVGAVRLELTGNPATMYPAILALEIGQRVTWKRKAQNQSSVLSVDMRIEAIGHATGPGHFWTTTLQLTPFNLAGGLPVGVWDVTNWDQSVWGI